MASSPTTPEVIASAPVAAEGGGHLDRPVIVQGVSILHLTVAAWVALNYGLVGNVPSETWLEVVTLVLAVIAGGLAIYAFVDVRRRLVRRASTWVLVSGMITITIAQGAEGFDLPWFVFYFWLISLGGLLLGRRTTINLTLASYGLIFLLWAAAQEQVGLISGPNINTLIGVDSLLMIFISMGLVMFVGWRVNGELIAIQQRLGMQVSMLSRDLAALSSGQATRSSEQTAIVADAVTALQELNASAEEIAVMANRVNRAALVDLHQTEEAQHVMHQTLEDMHQVSSLSSRVIERMHELSAMATQIGHVISLL